MAAVIVGSETHVSSKAPGPVEGVVVRDDQHGREEANELQSFKPGLARSFLSVLLPHASKIAAFRQDRVLHALFTLIVRARTADRHIPWSHAD